MNLANAGFGDIDSLLEASIEELEKVPEIGDILAHRLKESVERFIEGNTQRQKARQVRLASQIKKNIQLVSGIYDFHGDDFTRHIVKIFVEEFGLNAEFIGENRAHEPDILLKILEGSITIEAKRKEKGKVSALESEEILGKGAKYNPIASVTIGYPDFVEVAKENATNANITLIAAPTLGEILVRYWQGKINVEEILSLLKMSRYVHGIREDYL